MKVAKTKLLRSIEAKMTGNKMPVDVRFASITFQESKDLETYKVLSATEYRIGVNLSSTILIDDELDAHRRDEQLYYSTKTIGRGIAHEVYGELREKLIELAVQLGRESRFDSTSHGIVNELLEMIEYD